ncbi:MAG TPA: DUF1345 domain-containing protein [Stellaceae bacterium]|nr:DUF1345 domain-containing protein [Stellaceae bacterium]
MRLRRPRLLISAAAGIAAAAAAASWFNATGRIVIGWDLGATVYLGLFLQMAATATPAKMRRRAAQEDPARWVFLALMAAAAFVSMFAIFGLIHSGKAAEGLVSIAYTAAGAVTILLSWLFVHTVFAVHYAHDFVTDLAAHRTPGVIFPGAKQSPDYRDFLYFSFVVGMTCQVSDVQVATRYWRRLVLIHGVLSFFFNTFVLALSINLVAGLL